MSSTKNQKQWLSRKKLNVRGGAINETNQIYQI